MPKRVWIFCRVEECLGVGGVGGRESAFAVAVRTGIEDGGRFLARGVAGVMVVLVAVVVEESGRDCTRVVGLAPGDGGRPLVCPAPS